MNNSEKNDTKPHSQSITSGAARELADSMWAMLNQASGTFPLEVTRDLALKMVKVLAEVNASHSADSSNVVHSHSVRNLSSITPGKEPLQEII